MKNGMEVSQKIKTKIKTILKTFIHKDTGTCTLMIQGIQYIESTKVSFHIWLDKEGIFIQRNTTQP